MLTAEQRAWLRREVDRRTRARLRIVSAEHDLHELLAAGPRDAGDVVRELRAAGHSAQAVRTATRHLGVQARLPVWSLPEHTTEAA